MKSEQDRRVDEKIRWKRNDYCVVEPKQQHCWVMVWNKMKYMKHKNITFWINFHLVINECIFSYNALSKKKDQGFFLIYLFFIFWGDIDFYYTSLTSPASWMFCRQRIWEASHCAGYDTQSHLPLGCLSIHETLNRSRKIVISLLPFIHKKERN